MSDPQFLTLAEVIQLHADQIRRFGGDAGVRDLRLLESAAAQPESSFGGVYLHEGIYLMAAAYVFHICQNHPFVDGNKRTALSACLVFLELNGISIDDPKGVLIQTMLRMATGKMKKAEFARILTDLTDKA
jgi:death-on-curing protein